ncbi:MAG: metal ABC transporter substrate-binding protein [Dehalococcoidia bacterium]|nr:metal ABC transporter substrate-binding protein [Dehalococcoidia bacterium]
MSRLAILPAALLIALSLAACGGKSSSKAGGISVVTSLPVFGDMVEQVGGDRVDVSSLFPAGADPHTFEPGPASVRGIVEADIVFVNGLDLEPGAMKVIQPNLASSTPLVKLAEVAADEGRIELRKFGEDGHIAGEPGEEGTDPHAWLSVPNAREYARVIRDALVQVDPKGAATYDSNYDAYLARLDDLDGYVKETVSAVPKEQRKIVATHDAFGYMSEYMGLHLAAVVAESPGQEPSAGDVADLLKTIEKLRVAAVFEEPQLGSEATVLERAAEDTGIEVCTLYSDSLDDRVSTYIEMIRFNTDELARCLP